MPELPEVESLRIGLSKAIIGQKIISIKINNTKIISKKSTLFSIFDWEKLQIENQKTWQNKLVGQIFDKIERRAKNLIITMKSGDLLLIHLKMTGQLVFEQNRELIDKCENSKLKLEENFENDRFLKTRNQINSQIVSGGHPINNLTLPNKHTHLIFELTNGTLFYNDIRKFGYVYYFKHGTFDQNHFKKLGLEPLDPKFTLNYFSQRLKETKGVLKKIFLEQKIVVGLGNIYSDEVCFASKILPQKKVQNLSQLEIKKLYDEIIRIIPLAIMHGGSSISNYLLVDGKRGNYADFHLVYGKYGKHCSICNTILEKTKIGGRTTTFCPSCQS